MSEETAKDMPDGRPFEERVLTRFGSNVRRPYAIRRLSIFVCSLLVGWALTTPANLVAQQRGKSQTPKCNLTLEQAPELRGLKLGMSPEQFDDIYPGMKTNSIGVIASNVVGLEERHISQESEPGTSASRLQDVNNIDVRFIDGRLYWIHIYYDRSVTWNTVDEFALKVSESLNLPPAWTRQLSSRELICGSFSLLANVEKGNTCWEASLVLLDNEGFKKAAKRIAEWPAKKRQLELEEKERHRKVFKP
jgi:hypothetical protein